MKKTLLSILVIIGVLIIGAIGYVAIEFSNFGAGTLGGFDFRRFPVDKYTLESAVDQLLESDTTLKIPEKWKKVDDWDERGYDFLDTRIFYLSDEPEEMYYISFIGDSTKWARVNYSEIAIRAVSNGRGWTIEEHFSSKEKERIEERFNKEIVSRVEEILDVKSKREN